MIDIKAIFDSIDQDNTILLPEIEEYQYRLKIVGPIFLPNKIQFFSRDGLGFIGSVFYSARHQKYFISNSLQYVSVSSEIAQQLVDYLNKLKYINDFYE
jgi:hypothetical protein